MNTTSKHIQYSWKHATEHGLNYIYSNQICLTFQQGGAFTIWTFRNTLPLVRAFRNIVSTVL